MCQTRSGTFIYISATKADPFFWVQPNFGPNFQVQTGQVGPQDTKTGPIGSGWPHKGILVLSFFPFIRSLIWEQLGFTRWKRPILFINVACGHQLGMLHLRFEKVPPGLESSSLRLPSGISAVSSLLLWRCSVSFSVDAVRNFESR